MYTDFHYINFYTAYLKYFKIFEITNVLFMSTLQWNRSKKTLNAFNALCFVCSKKTPKHQEKDLTSSTTLTYSPCGEILSCFLNVPCCLSSPSICTEIREHYPNLFLDLILLFRIQLQSCPGKVFPDPQI